MTKEEESARLGRLTQEYSETKRHVALLAKELEAAAVRVQPLEFALRRAQPEKVLAVFAAVDFAQLKNTAERLAEASGRLNSMKETLRQFNIEV